MITKFFNNYIKNFNSILNKLTNANKKLSSKLYSSDCHPLLPGNQDILEHFNSSIPRYIPIPCPIANHIFIVEGVADIQDSQATVGYGLQLNIEMADFLCWVEPNFSLFDNAVLSSETLLRTYSLSIQNSQSPFEYTILKYANNRISQKNVLCIDSNKILAHSSELDKFIHSLSSMKNEFSHTDTYNENFLGYNKCLPGIAKFRKILENRCFASINYYCLSRNLKSIKASFKEKFIEIAEECYGSVYYDILQKKVFDNHHHQKHDHRLNLTEQLHYGIREDKYSSFIISRLMEESNECIFDSRY